MLGGISLILALESQRQENLYEFKASSWSTQQVSGQAPNATEKTCLEKPQEKEKEGKEKKEREKGRKGKTGLNGFTIEF